METLPADGEAGWLAISIHSTARVETDKLDNLDVYHMISIHSTARVETIFHLEGLMFPLYFNPLHREGGDDIFDTKGD